jgi:hypothetical protein
MVCICAFARLTSLKGIAWSLSPPEISALLLLCNTFALVNCKGQIANRGFIQCFQAKPTDWELVVGAVIRPIEHQHLHHSLGAQFVLPCTLIDI